MVRDSAFAGMEVSNRYDANSNTGALAMIRSDRDDKLATRLDDLLRTRDEALDRVEELLLRRSEVEDSF